MTAIEPECPGTPIYLDHHATTPLDPRVFEAMRPYWCGRVGNPSSQHHESGRANAEAIAQARREVADLVRVDPDEVIFTSGATESNNLALLGLADRVGPVRMRLRLSAIEHPSVEEPARWLARHGADVARIVPDRTGRVSSEAVEEAIRAESAPSFGKGVNMLSIQTANHEIGTVQPVAEVAALARAAGWLLHTDATQAIGKVPVDVRGWGVDLLSLSGHKMHGPAGVGALVLRNRGDAPIRIEPRTLGGGQEGGLRAGTLPVALIVGLGAACRIARESMEEDNGRLTALRDRLWARLRDGLDGIERNGDPRACLPNNLHVAFGDLDGRALLSRLGPHLAVSAGSACQSGQEGPSPGLLAIGLDPLKNRARLRFGLGRFTTAEEIDRAAEVIIATVLELKRAARPAWGAGWSPTMSLVTGRAGLS